MPDMTDAEAALSGKTAEQVKIDAAFIGQRLSTLTQEKLLEQVLRKHNGLYKVIPINLTTVQTQAKLFELKGGVLVVEFANADGTRNLTASINVRFNSPQNDPISFGYGDYLVHPFNSLYISWAAQSGITASLIIGYEFDNIFRLQRNTNANIASVSVVSAITGLTNVPTGSTPISARAWSDSGGAALTTLYTVTAGKTLYLANSYVFAQYSTDGQSAQLIVTDAADVVQYVFNVALGVNLAPFQQNSFLNHTPPIQVPAGYKIKMRKQVAAFTDSTDPKAGANIYGWEL